MLRIRGKFRVGSCLLMVMLLASCANGEKMTTDPVAIKEYEQQAKNGVFNVGGCVYHPGKFSLKSGQTVTLSEALQKAGGVKSASDHPQDYDAALYDVIVMRLRDNTVVKYSLNLLSGHTGGNFQIEAGDSIYVPMVIF